MIYYNSDFVLGGLLDREGSSKMEGKVPDYLKFERVYPFTRDPEFLNWMEEVFQMIRDQVPQDQSRYSKDWAGQGLTGLANAVDRKGSRLFDLMCLGMVGKDKIEDEFRDALMEAFYAYTYFMVLRRRHGGDLPGDST